MTWIKNPPEPPGLEVVNWALVASEQELLTWVPEDYRLRPDRAGYYRLTGFEETGRCWWCGAELTGRQRKYCRAKHRNEEGHWHIYYKHFSWSYARAWCIERQEGKCANCGKEDWSSLEVHHIIPLEGNERQWTPFNLPWNLMGFCHECHLEAHAAMRPERVKPDPWQARIDAGQLPLIEELLKEVNHASIS